MLKIAKAEVPLKLMEEASKVFLRKLDETIDELKKTQDIDVINEKVGEDEEEATPETIEEVRVKVIREVEKARKKIIEADSLDVLYDIDSEAVLEFLESKMATERGLCLSKLSEPAAKQIISNLTKFQEYLRSKPEGSATVREGVDTVYHFLKPFLNAMERLAGEEFENTCITYYKTPDGKDASKYRSLYEMLEYVNQNLKFFSDSEKDALVDAYDNIRKDKVKGFRLGLKKNNLIAGII